MSNKLYDLQELEYQQRTAVISWVSEQSKSQAAAEHRIVPVEPEDIRGKYMGFVAIDSSTTFMGGAIRMEFAGYVGAGRPTFNAEGQRLAQVGTLIVPERHRGYGVAHWLVNKVTNELVREDIKPFAFCNPASERAFRASSYVETTLDALPPAASSPYGNQPMLCKR